MHLLPMIILAVLNRSIYKTVIKFSKIQNQSTSKNTSGDLNMAGLLLSIVMVFVCCHSTKLVLNVFEGVQIIRDQNVMYWPQWAENLSYFNHLLLVINSSINILIYTAKDAKFRNTLISIFRCKKKERTMADISLNNIHNSEITKEDEI